MGTGTDAVDRERSDCRPGDPGKTRTHAAVFAELRRAEESVRP